MVIDGDEIDVRCFLNSPPLTGCVVSTRGASFKEGEVDLTTSGDWEGVFFDSDGEPEEAGGWMDFSSERFRLRPAERGESSIASSAFTVRIVSVMWFARLLLKIHRQKKTYHALRNQ